MSIELPVFHKSFSLASLPCKNELSAQYVCMCHLPLVQNTLPVTLQQNTALLEGSYFPSGLLLGFFSYLGGEKQDVSSLGMELQH